MTKARIFNLFLAAAAGAIGALTFSGCTAADISGTSAAVSGAGAACTADSDCAQGLECEHATCQPHQRGSDAGVVQRGDDGNDDGDRGDGGEDGEHDRDAGSAPACTVSTDCPSGQECDDGLCKVDDVGGQPGGDGSSGSGSSDSGSSDSGSSGSDTSDSGGSGSGSGSDSGSDG